MARVAERGSFVRSEVVAVLRDARLEDVVGKTHGLGRRVGGLELNAVGKVLPGADEQGVVVGQIESFEAGEQAQTREARRHDGAVRLSALRVELARHPPMQTENVRVGNIQHDAARQVMPYSDGELLCVGLVDIAVYGESDGCLRRGERWIVQVGLRWTENAEKALHAIEGPVNVRSLPSPRALLNYQS